MSTTVADRRRRSRPAPPIDSRVWERHTQEARRRGRRRLQCVLAVLVVVTIAAGTVALARSSLLDVDHVRIVGATRSGDTLARRATGIPRGRAMASVDPSAAVARLERLPWVADAKVDRQWPGTVRVHLVERTPVATVGPARARVLVDRTGRALGSAAAADQALPHLSGATSRVGSRVGPVRRRLAAVVGSLPQDLRNQVAQATIATAGSTFVLDDGIAVRWGDDHRSQAKADALRAILRQPGRPTIAVIDVTVPGAAAVTGKTGTGP